MTSSADARGEDVEGGGDHDVVVLAQTYLAMNAAESGSDVLIAGLIEETLRLRAALGEIADLGPATQEISLAGTMAGIAVSALTATGEERG